MSTGPSPTRRESVLATIVLLPLRAIERSRGWRRVVLLVLYGLIALGTWAILWRRSQLAALPDVGDPFGAAVRSPAPVPDERNAFVSYRRAIERFRDMNKAEGNSFSNADFAWARADATFRAWIAEHDEAISLLCAAAALPEFSIEVPADAVVQPASMDNNMLVSRVFWIATAGLFKAGRLRLEGNPAGAWSLLSAIIRASRHIEWAVPTASGRSDGFTLVQYAREPVAAWANDPAVGVALLRRALDDLAAAEALTPPLSVFYRKEYLASLKSLTNVQPFITARAQQRHDRGPWHLFALAPGLEGFLDGEPERSRRVLNLLVASDLAWCDRPASDRPAFAVDRLRIPEPDAAAPAAARALAPEELARWADSALITPGLNWRLGELDKWERIDRWSFSQLTEAVAVSLFTKETGHAPASPAEALRRYRPAPGDTPDRDEAEPICYLPRECSVTSTNSRSNGNTDLSTPNIDSLARDGALFERFFVCPVCSPTRAEFLTGRYHPRGGVWNVTTGGERLDLDEKTIGDTFKSAGYTVGAFTHWTSTDDSITWDVEVMSDGRYQAEVYYTAAALDTGATLELSLGGRQVLARVSEPFDPPLRGAEHDRVKRNGESYVKDFKPLELGILNLEQKAAAC